MSVTTDFQNAFAYLLTQKSTTTELFLRPLNTIIFQDNVGNTLATATDLSITYSKGTLTITAEFTANSSGTIQNAYIGNTYQSVFSPYFIVSNVNFAIIQGNLYEITLTIVLNNVTLVVSPFQQATVNANKLIDVIGNILAGNPLHTGKTGQFVDAIYVVNTTSNVNQSFRIPITIATPSPTLLIGGITPNTVIGNQIILRDSNQNDLITVTSGTPIRIKKGKQIVFEFTF